MTEHIKIGFIGGGNMANSIIGGMLQSHYQASDIIVSDPLESCRHKLVKQYAIQVTESNSDLVQCQIVVLAIKPQQMKAVLVELSAVTFTQQTLFVSIAAGINIKSMQQWLAGKIAMIRCMPNTPALVGLGMTGLFASDEVTALQKQQAQSLINSVGKSIWVATEDQIDLVTALSGSGPAYFFYFMEGLRETATQAGLTAQQANLLTLQTALGAATMAMDSDQDLADLRRAVTSPKGTTEAALKIFQQQDLSAMTHSAFHAAKTRAEQLSIELGDD